MTRRTSKSVARVAQCGLGVSVQKLFSSMNPFISFVLSFYLLCL